ncbi:MAG TPA: hypothetical protein VK166_00075 [Chitinophagaceae bacterium]|nr:hypothetical protein [Chitinophagaceae bacterium]
MKKQMSMLVAMLIVTAFTYLACKKEVSGTGIPESQNATVAGNPASAESNYELEVVLRGENGSKGHIHFGQDRDAAKIISLDTRVNNLQPNHNYLLQRAVDPMNAVDGNCTSTTWLTLGYGLTPHMITTDDHGDATDVIWRDVTAIPSGARFDIHFRVIDAVNMQQVLYSDCYQYTVR